MTCRGREPVPGIDDDEVPFHPDLEVEDLVGQPLEVVVGGDAVADVWEARDRDGEVG